MNIFSKITFNTLKKNRTRTIVTIIGIILSAAMFTAVISFISSMKSYLVKYAIAGSGDWYGVVYSADNNKLDELDADDRVSSWFELQDIGYSALPTVSNENKPYIYVTGASEDFIDNMPINLTKGRMPENSSEIIIPEHLLSDACMDYQIGDTITLGIGNRTSSEGEVLDQNTCLVQPEYFDGATETLNVTETRTYTVTGIYERPGFEQYGAPGYTVITTADEDFSGTSDVYIKTSDPEDIYDVMSRITKGNNLICEDNSSYLSYLGTSTYDEFYVILYGFASILIGLIMFGSISLIYNAFSISVSERTRQFGILSSIGATRRQIFRSVITEAVFLCAIGIPIGIICGLTGIGITLRVVTGLIPTFNKYEGVNLDLVISLSPILLSAAISAATVFLSAWLPARRAVKVTSIEAIRQSKEISTKDVSTTGLSKLLFGFEGMLAAKYFKRYKKKYRATVISLFMSIVLFVTASSFCDYLKDSVGSVYNTADHDISYSIGNSSDNDSQILNTIQKTEGVDKAILINNLSVGMIIDGSYLCDEYKDVNYLNDQDTVDTQIQFLSVSDDIFKEYLKQNNITDLDKYFDALDPTAIVVAKYEGMNNQGKYITGDIFSKIPDTLSCYQIRDEYFELPGDDTDNLTDEEMESYKDKWNIKVGACLDELPECTNGFLGSVVTVLFPDSVYTQLVKNFDSARYVLVKADDHKTAFENITKNLKDINAKTSSLYDYSEAVSNNRNFITVINIFSYGFIILISLIAVANVFNTITTNINLRRREFAMLRSVGMTQHGFYKMMDYECILYGFKSILLGIPVSLLTTGYMYAVAHDAYTTSYIIPYRPIIIATVCVFIVVFTTMIYAMQKIKNDNPIETLKNENL